MSATPDERVADPAGSGLAVGVLREVEAMADGRRITYYARPPDADRAAPAEGAA